MFAFISHYLGIECEVNAKAVAEYTSNDTTSTKKKHPDIILSTETHPRILTLDISRI